MFVGKIKYTTHQLCKKNEGMRISGSIRLLEAKISLKCVRRSHESNVTSDILLAKELSAKVKRSKSLTQKLSWKTYGTLLKIPLFSYMIMGIWDIFRGLSRFGA